MSKHLDEISEATRFKFPIDKLTGSYSSLVNRDDRRVAFGVAITVNLQSPFLMCCTDKDGRRARKSMQPTAILQAD